MELLRTIALLTAAACSPGHYVTYHNPVNGHYYQVWLQSEVDMMYVSNGRLKLRVWRYDGIDGHWEPTIYLEGSAFPRK